MANMFDEDLKSPITLAILSLEPLNSYHTCIAGWCKCCENLKQIRRKVLKLFSKDVKMLLQSRKMAKLKNAVNLSKIILSVL